MYKTSRALFNIFYPAGIALLVVLLFCYPALAAGEDSVLMPLWSGVEALRDFVSLAVTMVSDFYFSAVHGRIISAISYVWPGHWPQYDAMLSSYQHLFHTVPLWFTGNFWPSSLLGHFPRWGIDLFIITEVFYIALRLVSQKVGAFQGGAFVRFCKRMAYETWVFIKAPFFALFSVLFFLIKAEKEKRRILLFWLFVVLIAALLIFIVAWFAKN